MTSRREKLKPPKLALPKWIGIAIAIFVVLTASPWLSAAGPTYVSGPIAASTTWTLTRSPYIVTGDVTVLAGVTLAIEPGVEIRFNTTDDRSSGIYPTKPELIIRGRLDAAGTQARPIVFTSNRVGALGTDWGEIALRSNSNTIAWAEIRYATYGVRLYGTAGTPVSNNLITSCIFQRCGADRLVPDGPPCAGGGADEVGGAIRGEYANYCTFSTLTILYSERGIWLHNSDHNTIQGNSIHNMQQSAIRLSGDSDSNTLQNNTVFSIASYGVECWGDPGTPGDNNALSYNTIRDTWDSGLVFHYQNNGRIQNNALYDDANNFAHRSCNGAGYPLTLLSGLWISGTTDSLIENNTIYDNGNEEWGVLASGIYVGGDATDNVFRRNSIYNNQGSGIVIVGAGTDRNTLSENPIYDNVGLGIDLGDNGVTPNDPGDADSGPNEELNFPAIRSVTYLGAGNYQVQGTSTPNATVELFATDLDPSWHGEGEIFIASAVADGTGDWLLNCTISSGGILGSATATDGVGNTSEFCTNTIIAGEVWVNDDWWNKRFGDLVEGGIFGIQAFATIQDGVDAVAIGGIVHILPGIYWEQVVIEKSGITLEGEGGRDLVIVRGGGLSDYPTVWNSGVNTYAIAINPDEVDLGHPVNVTIRGLTVQKADAGIYMPRYTEGTFIDNCKIQHCLFGIMIERDAITTTLINNLFRDNEYSIAVGVHYTDTYTYTHAYNLNIINNAILDGNHQIDLQGEMVGILIWESDCADPTSDILIQGNEIRDQSFGIYLSGVVSATIHNNLIEDIPYRVTESNFAENGYGIYLYSWSGDGGCGYSHDMWVLTNTIKICYKGLVSRGADDVWVQGNLIEENADDGVEVSASTNEQVRWVIPVTIYADNNVLHGNSICGNGGYQLNNTQPVTNTGWLSATCNWWGTNTPVSGVHINSAANVTYSPWMTMTLIAVPPAISNIGTSTSLIYARYVCDGYRIPNGHMVYWATSLGTIDPEQSTTFNGEAWTELSSLEEGTAIITATDECGQVLTVTVPALPYRPDFTITEQDTTVQANSDETIQIWEYVGHADTEVVTITFPFRFDFNMNLPADMEIGSGSVQFMTPSLTCPLRLTVSDVLTREVPPGSGNWLTYGAHWVVDIDQNCCGLLDRDFWISGDKETGWTFLLVYPPDGDYVMTTTITTTLTIRGKVGATAVITNPSCATYYPIGVHFRSELDQIVCRSTGVTKVPTSSWIIGRYPSTPATQRGIINTTLPQPFVAWVHDNSWCNNGIANVHVQWDIIAWPEGAVGQKVTFYRDYTDDTGRAPAWLTLGSKRGLYVLRAKAPPARGEVIFSAYASEEGCVVTLISYGIDDTWVSDDEGNHYETQFLRMGDGRNDIGLRFRAPGVPQGSKITAAFIRFSPYVSSTAAITMTIYGEATDYAQPFLASSELVPFRPRTSAFVNWVITCLYWREGTRPTSPDISPVIQEIINRPGWVQHNALALLLIADPRDLGNGSRTVYSYEGAAAEESPWSVPELEICYIPPWAITPEPTPTPTETPWIPPTRTPTPSPSATPTATRTPTPSPTFTPTPSPSSTGTWTPTPTWTGTPPTPTPTLTGTPPTNTPTATRIPTWTPTLTATATLTRIPTWTSTPIPTGQVRGVVWTDNDEDGEIDLGEPPIGNVQITLRDASSQELQTTTTGFDGVYSFPELTPNTYIVQETDPPGYFSTTANLVQVQIVGDDVVVVNFGDKRLGGQRIRKIQLPMICR